jgi:hypothetical protein
MKEWESIGIIFLAGGSFFAAIKYLAVHANPGIAAILGSLPTGMAAIYLLHKADAITYSQSYFFNSIILFFTTMILYLLLTKSSMTKNNAVSISFGLWLLAVVGKYFWIKHKK